MSGSTLIATEKPEPHVHARRVVLDRRVDELLEAGERDDLVEALVELLLATSPRIGAVEVDVLPARELGVEARAELEQRRDLARRVVIAPCVGPQDPRDALEQRALARAVLADEPERRALAGSRSDTPFERPELLVAGAAPAHDRRLQGLVALVVEAEPLPDVLDRDHRVSSQTSSASRRSSLREHRTCRSPACATDHAMMYTTSRAAGSVRSYSTSRKHSTNRTSGLSR